MLHLLRSDSLKENFGLKLKLLNLPVSIPEDQSKYLVSQLTLLWALSKVHEISTKPFPVTGVLLSGETESFLRQLIKAIVAIKKNDNIILRFLMLISMKLKVIHSDGLTKTPAGVLT